MDYTSREVYEYVSKKANDSIMERKKCRLSWQDFPIYQSDLEFYDKVSPAFEVGEWFAKEFMEKNKDVKGSFEYKDWKLKAKIPTPTLCPEERERRRFLIMNDQHLYRRKLDNTWKQTISIISPDKPYIVYDFNYWYSRNRDYEELNQRSGNFGENFSHLLLKTPVADKSRRWEIENSEYCTNIVNAKDSYMCFYWIWLENCMYVYNWMSNNDNCVDCDEINMCSFCFDCVQLKNCSDVYHCQNCTNCHSSYYLQSCVWCHDCFNCVNLINKSYCINNEQYSKEEYEDIVKAQKETKISVDLKLIWCSQIDCENSYWNNFVWCKNSSFSESLTNCENVKYTCDILDMKYVYDGRWISSEFGLETYWSGYSYNCIFTFGVLHSRDSLYCQQCDNCDHIFWCVWLKDESYRIYNKQYTKEEYNQIVPQIIAQMIRDEEWWEFFNPQLAYCWYNESMSMEKYPLTKQEALERWYKWSDYESPLPKVEKIVQWKDLPKQWCKIIKEKKPEILEKILKYAIVCEVSKRPFRITKQEIEFYVKHNLPLPTKHPDIRHQERLNRKDSTIMHLINCDECWEKILSVHLPWEWKKVLCEKCFYKNI